MKLRFSKMTALVLACFLSFSALTACGNNAAGSAPSGSTPAGSSGAAEVAATSTPENAGLHNLKDGVLDIGTMNNWESLTPFRSNAHNNAPFATQIYETLVKLTYQKEYVPLVAKSWATTDGGLTYDIEIFDYVTDSAGNNIKADDIVWMIEESKAAGLKPAFGKVDTVTKTGDYTLQVKMKTNMVGAFEAILTNTFAVSKAAYEGSKDKFATEVISTAPYKVVNYTSGAGMSLEKRSDYWQKPELIHPASAANVDKITYKVILEASQAGIALESGDLDAYVNLDQNTASQFNGNDKFSLLPTSYINGSQLYFSGHPSRTIADDKYLRQAICYAIDTEGLLKGVYAGYGQTMHDPIADTSVGYLEKWKNEEYYPYNVEKAKELLAQSNYKGQELELLSGSGSASQRICQMVQAYLLQVGINVKLNLADSALITAIRLDGSKYDMFINTVGGDTLPDHWSIRYDSKAYKTGDATSRHDTVLDELLYKAWTVDGFTEENIDAVHQYIKENMYAYGMVQPQNIDVWRNDIGISDPVRTFKGSTDFAASKYN